MSLTTFSTARIIGSVTVILTVSVIVALLITAKLISTVTHGCLVKLEALKQNNNEALLACKLVLQHYCAGSASGRPC